VPTHPVHRVQDWDSPTGAILWDKFITFLRRVKETGEIPLGHRSHDHLNEQKDIPITEGFKDFWAAKFQRIKQEHETKGAGTKIMWAIVDGFLLYWHMVRSRLLSSSKVLKKGDWTMCRMSLQSLMFASCCGYLTTS